MAIITPHRRRLTQLLPIASGLRRLSGQRAISAADLAVIRIARRRAEEERGDTLFVTERRRSRRLQSAIRAERAQRAEQSLLMDAVRLVDGRHAAYGAEHVVKMGGICGLEGELCPADAVLAGVQSGGQDVHVLV